MSGFLALLLSLVFAIPAFGQVDERAVAADRLFGSMASDKPGAVVLVARGDEILYSRAFGAADLEQGTAINPDTRFHVASVSKQFTAFAIVLLAAEGKVDLDADIRTYLPEMPDFGTPIRVVDLLHHTSGLRDQWDLFNLSGTAIQSLLTQEAILALVQKQQALNFTPRAEYRYSNTGYTLAAEIVARTANTPFRQFVLERIFTPLGMTDSLIYDDAAEIVPGRAQSYAINSAGTVGIRRLNFSNYGATSMMTTAADLRKWSRELIEPKVFDPALIRSLYQPTRLSDGTSSNYGLGIYRTRVRGREAVMHSGSDAGFRAVVASYPADELSVIIVSNGSADLTPAHEGLVDIFASGTGDAPADIVPTPLQLQRLAGYYASGWGSGLQLDVVHGQLVRVAGRSPVAAQFKANGTIEFSGPVARYRIVDDPKSGVAALEELPPAGPPVRYARIEKRPEPIAELRALAGDYRSDELDITYILALAGDRLMMSSLQSPEPWPLTSIRRDWLDMSSGRVTVVRGADARPSGIRVTTGRSRDVLFKRVD